MIRALGLGLLLALAGSARAAEDFEGGLGIWTPTGLWHRVVSPACLTPHAGSAAVWFGRDGACDYADGLPKDQSLTSTGVFLSDPSRAFISFWMASPVESLDPTCYDRLRLERSPDGVNWALLQELSPSVRPPGGAPSLGLASGGGLGGPALWQYRSVDLSAFVGTTLYLRFRFLSSARQAGNALCGPADGDFDSFLGYGLDDISFGDPGPGLSLAKSVNPPFAAPGSTFTYSLTVKNLSPAAQALQVWDSLPAGASFVSADNGGVLGAGRVDWSLAALAPGASQTLTLLLQAPATAPVDLLNGAAAQGGGSAVDCDPVLARVRAPGLSLKKTVNRPLITSGDAIQYTLLVENFMSIPATGRALGDSPPSEIQLDLVYPSPGANGWDLSLLGPGQSFGVTLFGRGYGRDGQVVVNTAAIYLNGAPELTDSASITIRKPLEAQLLLRSIYPNPAPSEKPGFPRQAQIVYEANMAMPVTVDIFNVAGEKVRRLGGDGERGLRQVVWDLNNEHGAHVASGVYMIRVWSSARAVPVPEAVGWLAVER